jgi:hypothetical protein
LAAQKEPTKPELADIKSSSLEADGQRTPAGSGLWVCAQASVSRRVGRIDRLGDHALKTELAGVLQDESAITCLMTTHGRPICDAREN